MAKTIEGYIKLQIPAGKANPSPPIGPALGQRGIHIMDFCKAFNAQTQHMEQGLPVSVVITVYSDRSFTFVVKSPPASVLLRKAANLTKGSATPNTVIVATLKVDDLVSIAQVKKTDLTAASLSAAVKTLAGTAKSMGITVEGSFDAVEG